MKLLRTKHVVELTGLSRMTIYRMEKSGSFPARRQLGSNSVAWLEEDVEAWVRERPAPRCATLAAIAEVPIDLEPATNRINDKRQVRSGKQSSLKF